MHAVSGQRQDTHLDACMFGVLMLMMPMTFRLWALNLVLALGASESIGLPMEA